MPDGININPSGASGIISNIAASLISTIQVADPTRMAMEAKLQDEKLFASKGIFSPIGVLKNLMGDVPEEEVKKWRTWTLQNIENMPPAIAYTLFGDMYAHLLDYRAREMALEASKDKGVKEEGEQEKYFAAQRVQGKEKAGVRLGIPAGKIAKWPTKIDWLTPNKPEEEVFYDRAKTTFQDLTTIRLADPKADRVKNTIFVNYDKLAELVQERNKEGDPKKRAGLNSEVDKLQKMISVQKEQLQRFSKQFYLGGYTGEFTKSQRDLLGGMDVLEDYILFGNDYKPEMNRVVLEIADKAKQVGMEYIDREYESIIAKHPDAVNAGELVFRQLGQFGFGGLVQSTAADVMGSRPSKWLEKQVTGALTGVMQQKAGAAGPQPFGVGITERPPTYDISGRTGVKEEEEPMFTLTPSFSPVIPIEIMTPPPTLPGKK